MTEPFRVKTWLDAKYQEDVSFVKKFREIPDEPVRDFNKKKGEESRLVALEIYGHKHPKPCSRPNFCQRFRICPCPNPCFG